MIDLLEIINRRSPPEPWSEGDNIPWSNPGFSQRMLQEHLSQEHDAASRRFKVIDRHVGWIHYEILKEKPSRVLDLGCGPGLYASRLARLGHTCVGIDYSPASIHYGQEIVRRENLACTYLLQDLRQADFGGDFDLVIFIYGEFNVFRPTEANQILAKTYQSLKTGGKLLVEAHSFEMVWDIGNAPISWSAQESGLFSEKPHLLLEEGFWDEHEAVATRRYFVVDAASGAICRYAASYQAYTLEEYRRLLDQAGFTGIKVYASLDGKLVAGLGDFQVILAEKRIDERGE